MTFGDQVNRIRVVVLAVATVAAVGSLAACTSAGSSSGSSAASPPAPVSTVVSTATVAPSTTTSSSSSAADDSESASGNSACAESQLRASVEADDIPGLDRHVVRLLFKNTSDSTCTLTGYPGAAYTDVNGKQVAQAKRVSGGPVGGTIEKPGTITLRSGVTAYAYLEGASTREQGAAQAGCDGPKFPPILVTPPNTDTAVPFTIGWPLCHTFNVHPVRLDT